jgi:hypothetical protein
LCQSGKALTNPAPLVPKQHNTNNLISWNPSPAARISAFLTIALHPVITCMELLHTLDKKDPWSLFALNNYNLANQGVSDRLQTWRGI